MRYVPASQFDLSTLTRFWNLGYTDYFTPITFTEELMAKWIAWGDFDLNRSLVLMDGEELVGFSFLGVRGQSGWIGGFGVAPAYRGKGQSYQIFAQHVAQLQQSDLTHVRLEVLTENWARKVYERAGFSVASRLLILQGALAAAPGDAATMDWRQLLQHSERLHASHPACWQREPAYLTKQLPDHAVGIYTGPADSPTGMAICVANGNQVRLADVAATAAAAPDLVAAVGAQFPEATLTLLNEPESSPVAQALQAAGCKETKSQYDMHWRPVAGRTVGSEMDIVSKYEKMHYYA